MHAARDRSVHVQVDHPIVIEVSPGARVVARLDRQTRRGAGISPGTGGRGIQQGVGAVVREKEIEPSVGVHIGHAHAHAPLAFVAERASAGFYGRARRDVREMPVVVLPETVRVSVHVGGDEIEVPVLIDVEPDRSDGPPVVADTGFFGYVHEPSGAVVPKKSVGPVPECEEEIQITIGVVVDPRGLSRRSLPKLQTNLCGDVGEARVTVVSKQRDYRSVAGKAEQQVGISVGVEVTPSGRPHGSLHHQAHLNRNVDETTGKVIAVQPTAGAVEADEAVGIAVPVDIRPGIRQRAPTGEKFGLYRYKADRLGWARVGTPESRDRPE